MKNVDILEIFNRMDNKVLECKPKLYNDSLN